MRSMVYRARRDSTKLPVQLSYVECGVSHISSSIEDEEEASQETLTQEEFDPFADDGEGDQTEMRVCPAAEIKEEINYEIDVKDHKFEIVQTVFSSDAKPSHQIGDFTSINHSSDELFTYFKSDKFSHSTKCLIDESPSEFKLETKQELSDEDQFIDLKYSKPVFDIKEESSKDLLKPVFHTFKSDKFSHLTQFLIQENPGQFKLETKQELSDEDQFIDLKYSKPVFDIKEESSKDLLKPVLHTLSQPAGYFIDAKDGIKLSIKDDPLGIDIEPKSEETFQSTNVLRNIVKTSEEIKPLTFVSCDTFSNDTSLTTNLEDSNPKSLTNQEESVSLVSSNGSRNLKSFPEGSLTFRPLTFFQSTDQEDCQKNNSNILSKPVSSLYMLYSTDPKPLWYTCNECKKEFTHESALVSHQRFLHGQEETFTAETSRVFVMQPVETIQSDADISQNAVLDTAPSIVQSRPNKVKSVRKKKTKPCVLHSTQVRNRLLLPLTSSMQPVPVRNFESNPVDNSVSSEEMCSAVKTNRKDPTIKSNLAPDFLNSSNFRTFKCKDCKKLFSNILSLVSHFKKSCEFRNKIVLKSNKAIRSESSGTEYSS